MRINSSNLTLTRNYLQKYRFLIREYELVKQNKHPHFRFVHEFCTAHDTDRRSFLKYYNRFRRAYIARLYFLMSCPYRLILCRLDGRHSCLGFDFINPGRNGFNHIQNSPGNHFVVRQYRQPSNRPAQQVKQARTNAGITQYH